MKRITLLLVGLLSLPFFSYSGGIVTNQNQSAAYIRMFARDASTDIDAVFFNPAGLTKLEDGFHLGLNYQYIKQNKVVTSDYMYLEGAPTDFEGEINVPIFPSVYAAYKTGKWVFSFGWNPVGGGGGATFEDGLPSFEMMVSDLVPLLQSQLGQVDQGVILATGNDPGFRNVTGYNSDIYFEGTSVFYGYQLNGSYEINDMISAAIGIRYISAKNTYEGYLRDVTIDAPEAYGGTQAPGDYVRVVQAATGNAALAPLADALDANAADIEVDVEQTGSAYAPILGLHITPTENLSVALKYEFAAELELENNTTVDGSGLFPDKEKTRNDMPALFSIGFDYNISDKLSVASGFHMYFDKNADYGRKLFDPVAGESVHVDNDEVIDRNSTEFALGIEYMFTDKLLLSIGYLNTQTGVSEDYQTDLSYSQHSNTIGLGGRYAVSPAIDLNVGVGYTMYNDARKIYTQYNTLGQALPTTEEYDKDNLFVSFGLDFNFWGKKAE
jgi:long-subunit fatty acid transport protein